MTHVAQGGLSAADRAKLDGIATAATANSPDATLLARGNHTGTQAASTISDPSAFAAATTTVAGNLSSADKTKLDGIATAATANSPDATLLARGNHTGTQAASTISDPSAFAAATTTVAGNLSSADKTKLDGIATAATANASNADLRDRTTHTGAQPASTISDPATFQGRTNHTGTQAASTISDPRTFPVATTTLNGLLPFADKVKLDALTVSGGDFDPLALGGAPWFVPNATTVTLPNGLIAVDVATGEPMRVAANTDVLITASGVNGLDAGSEAADTWYYLWLIKQTASPLTVGAVLSTSTTNPTMPAGYTHKRLIGAVRNDGSSNFIPGYCTQWGNGQVTFMPDVRHSNGLDTATAPTQIGTNLTATSFTLLSCAAHVPAFVRFAQLWVRFGTSMTLNFRERGATHTGYGNASPFGNATLLIPVRLNASQEIDYRVDTSGIAVEIFTWIMRLDG